MVAADDLADFVVEDAGVQAVGAVHEEIAVLERLGGKIGLAERLDAHGAGEFAPLAAGHGLPLEHEAEFDRQGGGDVVLGKLENLLLADEVGAGVADVGDVGNPVADD